MAQYGTIELGGTKILVAAGSAPTDMTEPARIATTEPAADLDTVVELLRQASVEAVGIASFGPLELRRDHPDYGSIISTPKPGWSGAPIATHVARALDVPVAIDTDVNGAALGEGRWGASVGLNTHAYMTVGTGVGIGAVTGGRSLVGLGHPEMGHVVVVPRDDDTFGGRCPFHGTCLEGMVSGPALQDRFGPHDRWKDDTTELAAHYVAQGLRTAVYTLAPERIVVGGGVSKLEGFHEMVRVELKEQLAGYPEIPERDHPSFIVPPVFENSGLVGGLLLARAAVG